MRDFCEVKSFTCSLEQVTEHIWVFDYFRCSFKSAVFELFETWGVVSIFKVLWTCQLFCPLTHWAVWANSFLFIESIMLCNYLILQLPPPLALNLSRHQGLFQWVGSWCQYLLMPIAFDASISLGNILNIPKTLQIFSSSVASYQSHNMTWDQKCNDFLRSLKKKPNDRKNSYGCHAKQVF